MNMTQVILVNFGKEMKFSSLTQRYFFRVLIAVAVAVALKYPTC